MSSHSSWSRRWNVTAAAAGALALFGGFALFRWRRGKGIFNWTSTTGKRISNMTTNRLQRLVDLGAGSGNVTLVSSTREWEEVEGPLREALLAGPRLLGFDCEWVGSNRVALIQLATHQGWCLLVRTCRLAEGGGGVPPELAALLADPGVLKLGVGIADDARRCAEDLGAPVAGFVDVRHLLGAVRPDGIRKTGLAGLAREFLGVVLDKDWRIRTSDWEAPELSARQVDYAANDALVGINVGLSMTAELLQDRLESGGGDEEEELAELSRELRKICEPFSEMPIKIKSKVSNPDAKSAAPKQPGASGAKKELKVKPKRNSTPRYGWVAGPPKSTSVRKSPLYHNAMLEAPDGEMLCVCDVKKAEWYISKGLGERVAGEDDDPLTVRLKFQPAGRPEGTAGAYYLTVKDNQCVVCGREDSYVRKYIVPHEYRKHFPEIMRDHASHDVLLMCYACHTHSNLLDLGLRRDLAAECGAPIGTEEDVKVREDQELKGVRSASRALLKDREAKKIPAGRVRELETVLVDYYKTENLTKELLRKGADLETNLYNEDYRPHGKKVVEHYAANDGILALERKWRQHFLDNMNPLSVDHQQMRLEYKASGNRIKEEDMRLAKGLANSGENGVTKE